MRDLADQLFDLTLDHHALRANLLGLRHDGVLQDHSEEADQEHLRRYREISEEAGRRTAATEDDRITRGLVLHLAQSEIDIIERIAVGVVNTFEAAWRDRKASCLCGSKPPSRW